MAASVGRRTTFFGRDRQVAAAPEAKYAGSDCVLVYTAIHSRCIHVTVSITTPLGCQQQCYFKIFCKRHSSVWILCTRDFGLNDTANILLAAGQKN